MRFLVIKPLRDVVEEDWKGEGVECMADETDGWERALVDMEEEVFEQFQRKRVHREAESWAHDSGFCQEYCPD